MRNQARLIEIEYIQMSGSEVCLCFPITTLGITLSIAFSSVQFSSVAQSCQTLCDPMDCSTPGFPVPLPELAQTHVHRVGDAIEPSHLLSFPSPPASILPSIRVFSNESGLCIRWPKYWSFSFRIIFRIDFLLN